MDRSSAYSDSSSSSSTSTFFNDDKDQNTNNASSVSSVFSRLAGTVRDTRTKVEQKKLEINATMQEKLPEWKLRGMMYANNAREAGIVWSKKGKDAVDRWKRNQQGTSSTSTDDFHIFGLPLQIAVELTSLSDNDHIPAIVRRCIEYLDAQGIHEVGIYRLSGSVTMVNKLKTIFDAGAELDFQTTRPDPHTVSTLLKTYLRALPEPMVPADITKEFAEITQGINVMEGKDGQGSSFTPPMTTDVLERIRLCAEQLPIHHFALLKHLCQHLKRVDDHRLDNRMSTSNLALIFMPTLGINRTLFHCMVDHANTVFKGLPKSTAVLPISRPLPPPLPTKPPHIQTLKTKAGPYTNHAKTRSDTELLTMAALKSVPSVPPPKPSRSPNAQLFPHSADGSDQATVRPKKTIDATKRRSKSLSSTSVMPTWRRAPVSGSRVEAIGRQFEALALHQRQQ